MSTGLPHYRQEKKNTCALACLRMVLASFGTDVEEGTLANVKATVTEPLPFSVTFLGTGKFSKSLDAVCPALSLAVAPFRPKSIPSLTLPPLSWMELPSMASPVVVASRLYARAMAEGAGRIIEW